MILIFNRLVVAFKRFLVRVVLALRDFGRHLGATGQRARLVICEDALCSLVRWYDAILYDRDSDYQRKLEDVAVGGAWKSLFGVTLS